MIVAFYKDRHKYESIDLDTGEIVTKGPVFSVTEFLKSFDKKPFDKESIAEQVSKNKNSKYYGKSVDEIVELWNKEGEKAVVYGKEIHKEMENYILSYKDKGYTVISLDEDKTMKAIDTEVVKRSIEETSWKKVLLPEHILLKTDIVHPLTRELCNLAGQSDLIIVDDNVLHIVDYKTNKDIFKAVDYKVLDFDLKTQLSVYYLQAALYAEMFQHQYNRVFDNVFISIFWCSSDTDYFKRFTLDNKSPYYLIAKKLLNFKL